MLPFPIMNTYGNTVIRPSIQNIDVCSNGGSVLLSYSNGEVYALGTNQQGKYGTGNTTTLTSWTLLRNDVRLYTSTGVYSILITKDNKVYGSGAFSSLFSPAFGYNIPASTVYQDISSAFSTFNISGIKSIVGQDNSGTRLFVVDENDQVYGIGSNQYNALGTGSSTAHVDWTLLTNASNVQSVQPTLYSTWIMKKDGTIWRVGTNSVGTLAASSSSQVYNTFTQYSTLAVQNISCSQYNVIFHLTDGTIRVIGVGSSGQAGNGSTATSTIYTPYNAGLTGVTAIQKAGGSLYSTIVRGSSTLLSTGSNTNGLLGTGISTNPTTTFTNSSTGILATQNLSTVGTFISVTNASYYIYSDEVYATGAAAMTLGTSNRNTWAIMTTPHSTQI